jgi:TPR repeat protein
MKQRNMTNFQLIKTLLDGQEAYGFCLEKRKGVLIDLNEAAKYSKLSAGQGNAFSPFNHRLCLEFNKDVSIDLNEAAKYYKLSADQGNAAGQVNYGYA